MANRGSKPHLTMESKIKLSKAICELYAQGNFTIASCCEAVGVKYTTFKQWAQPNLSQEDIEVGKFRRGLVLEVHDLYKRALEGNETNYKALLKDATREGLLIRASGTKLIETQTESKYDIDGIFIGVSIRKIERSILPDTGLLIFLAKNLDKENFSINTNQTIIATEGPCQHFTYEQLTDKIIELQNHLENDNELN
jgi:hypothetical protein